MTGNAQGDVYTAKYAAADGALLWEQRYNGPANQADHANALVLDDAGNIVVTGDSVGQGSNSDYYTVKYAAGSGEVLWEARYNGRSKNDDSPPGSGGGCPRQCRRHGVFS